MIPYELGDVLLVGANTYAVVSTLDLSMDQVVATNVVSGKMILVNADASEVKLHARPRHDWFLLPLPLRKEPLTSIRALKGRRIYDLALGEDWVPSDISRKGGAIYLNPSLKYLPGDVLTLVYKNGSVGKYTVPAAALKSFDQRAAGEVPDPTPSPVWER